MAHVLANLSASETGSVTGFGCSGAIAALYASHLLGVLSKARLLAFGGRA